VTVIDRVASWFAPTLSMPSDLDTYLDGWMPPELSLAASAPPPMVTAVKPASSDKPGNTQNQRAPREQEWQDLAWDYYRHMGEARQAVNWLAHGVSRCHLFIGKVPEGAEGDPTPVDNPGPAGEVLAELYDGPIGQAAMLQRLAVHLLVPGESWLAGYPRPKDPEDTGDGRGADQAPTVTGLDEEDPEDQAGEYALDETGEIRTAWAVLSRKEWQETTDAAIRLKLPKHPHADLDNWVEFPAEMVALVPVYEPDAQDSSLATSSFQAALGTLDELDGLSRRVGADILSRLLNAGILPIPESATIANPGASEGVNPIGGDPFIAALLAAARKRTDNLDDPASHVPIVVKVPDEAYGKLGVVDMATSFDAQIPSLREMARRTLAADLDIPSSIVLGVEDLNHWSAWSVHDDAIRAHLGPLISRICVALTIEILWPALQAAGDTSNSLCIWWSAAEITQQPDRSDVTLKAHDQGLISDKAARRELRFDETDAPTAEEKAARAGGGSGGGSGGDSGGDGGGQASPGETPTPPEQSAAA
jgi:hypothetical protein